MGGSVEFLLGYEPENEHRLIFTPEGVFGIADGRIKTATLLSTQPPAIAVRELQKVPAGYVSFREYLFYPELFEEYRKFLHVLLLVEIPVELSVVGDVVSVTHNAPEETLRISRISIENSTLVMERTFSSNLKTEDFRIRELAGFYVVEEYRGYRLKTHKTRRLSGDRSPNLQKA